MLLELTVRFRTLDETPRELRERFAQALRAAIDWEYQAGRIDLGLAEELRRTLPEPGKA